MWRWVVILGAVFSPVLAEAKCHENQDELGNLVSRLRATLDSQRTCYLNADGIVKAPDGTLFSYLGTSDGPPARLVKGVILLRSDVNLPDGKLFLSDPAAYKRRQDASPGEGKPTAYDYIRELALAARKPIAN